MTTFPRKIKEPNKNGQKLKRPYNINMVNVEFDGKYMLCKCIYRNSYLYFYDRGMAIVPNTSYYWEHFLNAGWRFLSVLLLIKNLRKQRKMFPIEEK